MSVLTVGLQLKKRDNFQKTFNFFFNISFCPAVNLCAVGMFLCELYILWNLRVF